MCGEKGENNNGNERNVKKKHNNIKPGSSEIRRGGPRGEKLHGLLLLMLLLLYPTIDGSPPMPLEVKLWQVTLKTGHRAHNIMYRSWACAHERSLITHIYIYAHSTRIYVRLWRTEC
jgi:hypothetical protein|uniref:Uncharacterized protein n=1 Tax=Sipha flava TaxID=143950 RepID=A0A2S2Q3I7_9HEMI